MLDLTCQLTTCRCFFTWSVRCSTDKSSPFNVGNPQFRCGSWACLRDCSRPWLRLRSSCSSSGCYVKLMLLISRLSWFMFNIFDWWSTNHNGSYLQLVWFGDRSSIDSYVRRGYRVSLFFGSVLKKKKQFPINN